MASAGKAEIIEFLTTAPNKKTEAAYETAAEAKRAVENTIEAIKALFAKKDAEGVAVVGLGGFKRVKLAACMGINPSTREKIKIKASKTVSFKDSKAFKDSLS